MAGACGRRAGGRSASGAGAGGVAPATMPSAMPYSNGKAPAMTAAGAVDVLDAGRDDGGVPLDRRNELVAFLERARRPWSAVRRRSRGRRGEARDRAARSSTTVSTTMCRHDRTLSSTWPRNRRCSRPSASTASTLRGRLTDQRRVGRVVGGLLERVADLHRRACRSGRRAPRGS